jgi:dTDP-4-amino-4,6-dideoxygalactose transaminase
MAAHLEPAYSARPHSPMPVTERLTASSVILPLFHQLTEQEQDLVVSVLLAAAADRRCQQPRSPAPVVQSADRSM